MEQNNASKEAVLLQVANSEYAKLWEAVWEEPISIERPSDVEKNFDRIGLAIAAYEGSEEVNQFSSKYDMVIAGDDEFTIEEEWGYDLFNGKGLCSECHPEPLFTDFTYDNLGIPKNPENPFYDMDNVYLDDSTKINPQGAAWIDKGLGGFLETRPEWADMAAENYGKHKVPTLRNIAKASSEEFTKAFTHNGVFKSLLELVHFYNTRDIDEWPEPEVVENVNIGELGNLELTEREEAAIVAFMMTLSDGYVPEK